MKKKFVKKGIFLAILAAALYAINAPFSKMLLEYIPSTMMAGLLYIGAAISLFVFREVPGTQFLGALVLMIFGAWLSSGDEPLLKKE